MTRSLLVLLTAATRDPGKLATITFAGAIGAFAGALAAHVRGLPPTRASDLMRLGMVIGVACGLAGWLVVLATDLL